MNGATSAVSPGLDYLDVTELSGAPISAEQLERLRHRYAWALPFCEGKDVVELACGTGPGLGMIASVAASLEASDVSRPMLDLVRAHYGDRVRLSCCDAAELPFSDQSKDIVILFEALYYLTDVGRFFAECRRVLRPGGSVIISTANKDLPDFNPSPYSHRYLGAVELRQELASLGFTVECFGYIDTRAISLRQKVFRPVKRLAVGLGLIPKTMKGKQLLKRLVFGRPVSMPPELEVSGNGIEPPICLDTTMPDRHHKVLYCVASLSPDSDPSRR